MVCQQVQFRNGVTAKLNPFAKSTGQQPASASVADCLRTKMSFPKSGQALTLPRYKVSLQRLRNFFLPRGRGEFRSMGSMLCCPIHFLFLLLDHLFRLRASLEGRVQLVRLLRRVRRYENDFKVVCFDDLATRLTLLVVVVRVAVVTLDVVFRRVFARLLWRLVLGGSNVADASRQWSRHISTDDDDAVRQSWKWDKNLLFWILTF